MVCTTDYTVDQESNKNVSQISWDFPSNSPACFPGSFLACWMLGEELITLVTNSISIRWRSELELYARTKVSTSPHRLRYCSSLHTQTPAGNSSNCPQSAYVPLHTLVPPSTAGDSQWFVCSFPGLQVQDDLLTLLQLLL